MLKNIITLLLIAIFTISCATWEVIDHGTVIDSYQLPDPKLICDESVKTGKSIGTTVGAGIGGTAGAVTGMMLTLFTLGAAAPLIPTLTATGATAGGGAGHAVGGFAGKAVSKNTHSLFEYEIVPDEISIDFLFISRCDIAPLADGSKVRILQKQNQFSIEPVEPIIDKQN